MTFLQAQLLVKFLDGDVFLIRVVIVDSRSFQLFQILLTYMNSVQHVRKEVVLPTALF